MIVIVRASDDEHHDAGDDLHVERVRRVVPHERTAVLEDQVDDQRARRSRGSRRRAPWRRAATPWRSHARRCAPRSATSGSGRRRPCRAAGRPGAAAGCPRLGVPGWAYWGCAGWPAAGLRRRIGRLGVGLLGRRGSGAGGGGVTDSGGVGGAVGSPGVSSGRGVVSLIGTPRSVGLHPSNTRRRRRRHRIRGVAGVALRVRSGPTPSARASGCRWRGPDWGHGAHRPGPRAAAHRRREADVRRHRLHGRRCPRLLGQRPRAARAGGARPAGRPPGRRGRRADGHGRSREPRLGARVARGRRDDAALREWVERGVAAARASVSPGP